MTIGRGPMAAPPGGACMAAGVGVTGGVVCAAAECLRTFAEAVLDYFMANWAQIGVAAVLGSRRTLHRLNAAFSQDGPGARPPAQRRGRCFAGVSSPQHHHVALGGRPDGPCDRS